MTDLTLTEIVVLAALSDQAQYGYELARRVEELTDGRVSVRPGNLYRVLHRLAEQDLVAERPEQHAEERRRYFRATARGKRVAAEQLAMYSNLLRRVAPLREALARG